MAVLYTTVGGVIGAVATQYLTHARDRRSARALVLEYVSKIEAAYAGLKPTFGETSVELDSLHVSELLGSLEAAALIAGVPRSFLQLYVSSVRLNCECKRMEAVASSLTLRALKGASKVLNDKSLGPAKVKDGLQDVLDIAKRLQEMASDECIENVRLAALSLLSIAMWHPLAVQLFKKKASRLKSTITDLDDASRRLASASGSIEGKVDFPSYVISLLNKLGNRSFSSEPSRTLGSLRKQPRQ